MKVSEVMTREVHIASAEDTIHDAARAMASLDSGVLPIADDNRLVGMLTDRDIVVEGIAQGKGLNAKVRDVMTPDVKYCFDDQEVDEVMLNMGDLQLRRLLVLNHENHLVGILSLGDVATSQDKHTAIDALQGISRPGSTHRSRATV